MDYNSIGDIYSANQLIRKRFQRIVDGITPDEANAALEGEKWTVAALVEHVAIVEFNMMKICSKLLSEAKEAGTVSDGKFALSATFGEKSAEIATIKVNAPERVHPQGGIAISDSLEKMSTTTVELSNLRDDFESHHSPDLRFPHPFFGELTAGEWLVLVGGHESRHIAQITRLLAKIRQ